MIIKGDLGEAVFRFTEKATPERIAGYNLGYFCEKLRAFTDSKDDFSRIKANQYLDEMLKEFNLCNAEYDKDAFQELRSIIDDSETYEDYRFKVFNFDYYRLGDSAWEWVGNLGSTTPMRLMAYLIGIKLAMG